MKWFDDEKVVSQLMASEELLEWANAEAMEHFAAIRNQLPEPLREKSRIGPLTFGKIEDTDSSLYCWMYPVDGSKFQGVVLGLKNRVKLVDKEGRIFFEGLWEETTLELIQAHPKFYIWVEPIERKESKEFKIPG